MKPLFVICRFAGLLAISFVCFSGATETDAQDSTSPDWPQFRGTTGESKVDSNPPTEWTAADFRWKVDLPGRGWSSPVFQNGQVWLTAAVERKATEEEIAKKLAGVDFAQIKTAAKSVEMMALCVDLETGKLLKRIELGSTADPQPINPMNSYASPTCAIADGKVVCHFGAHGTWCLDCDSFEVLWQRKFVINHSVGPGSSPVIENGKVILVCDGCDLQYIVAVKLTDGETIWKTDRPPIRADNGEFKKSYSTPLIVGDAGNRRAVVPGAQWICSYDVESGAEIWRADYGDGYSVTPMAVLSNGLYIFSSAYNKVEFVAVKPGMGDVTDSIQWRARNAPAMSSFVADAGKIYSVSDRPGVIMCLDAETGTVENKLRFMGNVSASLLLAGGHLYAGSRDGEMRVVKCDPNLETVSSFDFGSPLYATPTVVGDDLLVRTKDSLIRIGAN